MEFYIVGLIALIFYAFYQNTSTKKIIDKFKSSENINLFNLLNQKVLELNEYKNYLDKSERINIQKDFDTLEIPPIYKNHKIAINKISSGLFDKLDRLALFKESIIEYLNDYNQIFISKEMIRYKTFFDKIEKNPLTEEQRAAVITNEENTLLVAGAGSGKTSVIAAKYAYLIEKKICNVKNILAISFTSKSADELNNRVIKIGATKNPEIYTFHKYGYDIYKQANIDKPSIHKLATDDGYFNNFVKNKIENYLSNKENKDALRYFVYYLKPYQSVFEFKKIGEYWKYLKSNEITKTLKGENVKSYEECEIANYLYIYQINYEYEKDYKIPTRTSEYRQYKPDFYLPDYDIYIEHSALGKNNKPPKIFKGGYLEKVLWAREQHRVNKTTLVETFSYEKSEGVLLSNLNDKLKKLGVVTKQLPKDVILNKFNESNKVIDFSKILQTFLNHFKSNEFTIKKIEEIAARYNTYKKERAEAFIKIFKLFYLDYKKELGKEIDYVDMIVESRKILTDHINTVPISHIFIDEFQDISQDKYKLIQAIIEKNPKIKTFSVGDDWQSIYKFAGSDIDIMNQYERYFGHTKNLYLTNTFRFPQTLANTSSNFIMENSFQIDKKIKSLKSKKNYPLTIYYKENNENIEKSLQNIINLNPKDNHMLLQRNKYIFSPNNKMQLQKKNKDIIIKLHTVHAAKGLEEDIVIVIDVNRGKLGFPSEIEDDPVLDLVKKDRDEISYAEERRLFYVAITRAKKKVFLITDKINQSSFIRELVENNYDVDYMNKDEVDVLNCEECEIGWMVRREGRNKDEDFYSCSNFPLCNFTYQICRDCKKGIFKKNNYSEYMCTNEQCLSIAPHICNKCGEILNSPNKLKNKKGNYYFRCFKCNNMQDFLELDIQSNIK